jgi:N-acetylmuramoyl-L-alanine amidase
MSIKVKLNYSPNFNQKKRNKDKINFLIFHYTGMKSEKLAINRLTKIQSQVSCHYFIKRNGEIISIVPDLYIAWHAGVSYWKKYKFLNKNSIGIEISNPGHQFGYVNFTKIQIKNLIKLSKFLIKKYKIKKDNILGHSDIAPNRKIDPGEKFPWEYLSKKGIGVWHQISKKRLINLRRKKISLVEFNFFKKNLKKIGYIYSNKSLKKSSKFEKLLIKAFQRRFRPQLLDGKIDQECLLIISKLLNKNTKVKFS